MKGQGNEGAPARPAAEWSALLERDREALFTRVLRADPLANLEHPIEHGMFGPLNWRETLLFMRLHDLDHAGQLQKIAAALTASQHRLMRVAITLWLANEDWRVASEYVVEAERLGVDCLWSAEAWGHDAATPLAFMAARTSRIRLGTGIMQAGTRTPALLAMTAMSLNAMSGGRFILGLGVSGPQVIEGWHGIRFERPVQRMREIVEIVRRATRGERLAYKGKIYELPLPGRRGQGAPLCRQAPAGHSDLSRHAVPEEPRDDGRDRRRLARHFLHARARARLLRSPGGRRRPRRAARSPSSISRRAASSPSPTTSSG